MPPPTPRRERKTTSINSPASNKSCDDEEEGKEEASETPPEEKAVVVGIKRERSPSPPVTSKSAKTDETQPGKDDQSSPANGANTTTAKSKTPDEALSPGSSKDDDGERGGGPRNRSLEALFQVTDSELQNIASKDNVIIIQATDSKTSAADSVQEANVSAATRVAAVPVATVLDATSGDAVNQVPPIGDNVEMVQIVTVIPEDIMAYQLLGTDQSQQKFQLRSDSAEDSGYKIVYVEPDGKTQDPNTVAGVVYPTQTVQIVQNTDQVSSGPSTPPATSANQDIARKRKYQAQKPGRHICPYCNRGCAKPSVLEKHIRAHTNERPYPCVPCGFSFKTKSNLYKHCKSRAHAIKVGHSAASIEEMDLNKSTDKEFPGEGSDISESEGDGDDGGAPIDVISPPKRLNSQGQSTDSDCPVVMASFPTPAKSTSSHSQIETPEPKEEIIIIGDSEDVKDWRLQRPSPGKIIKAHSFSMHPVAGERLLLSSGSFDSSAAEISRAEKQSKFLRSASEPAKSMTPEMLHQRIAALISANDAVLSTPMADPPRPKRLSRQNSENKEYTQPRLLLQQGGYQQQGNVVVASTSQVQAEGVRILPKPQVATPVKQEQYYIINDPNLQRVAMSPQMAVPQMATPIDVDPQTPKEIKIQIQLPKPAAGTSEGTSTPTVSSSVIKDLLMRTPSQPQMAVVPESQPNIRRMLSAPQMTQPKCDVIDHIIVEEAEGGQLIIADTLQVELTDHTGQGDRLDGRSHISRARSLDISSQGHVAPSMGRLSAASSLSLSNIPAILQRSASLGHHLDGSHTHSQPNLAQHSQFQRQASMETPTNQGHASTQSLQRLRGKILMRRSMSAERVLEDESPTKPDPPPKISQTKQMTTPEKRKEAYKSMSLGKSSLTSSLKQTSMERMPSVEKQVSFEIDLDEKQREPWPKAPVISEESTRSHTFMRAQSEPIMTSRPNEKQTQDELAMPLAIAVQLEPQPDLTGQSLLGLLPMPPKVTQSVVATGQKVISVALPCSKQQAFILPVNQSFQFFKPPRLAIAPMHLSRIYGHQMSSISPNGSKPASSPKETNKASSPKEHGKVSMRVLADLKSPSIHNLPPEKAISLLLLGHNYPSLRMSTNLSFCSLQGTQPTYVPLGNSNKISMYSNWKTASHNPNPMGLSSKSLFSLYRTRKRSEREYFVTAPTQESKAGVLTHSSAWNFFSKLKTPVQRNTTAPVVSCRVVPTKTLPEIAMSPQRAKDDSNILMTKMTKFIKLPPVTKQASLDENALRRNSENRELKRSLSEMVHPKRVKIFKGGWKSEEEYVYIRGRGRGKYVCEECGIRCKKPSMLRKHIRTHTDVRPYVCKHCHFSFKTKGNLTKHMKSKSHQRKCVELGVLPVPICIDDSQIDLEALARQARLTKAQKALEDEVGADSDDDGDQDDDDDEDMDIDDEMETRESVKVLTNIECIEPDHEEEVMTVDTSEKLKPNTPPAYVAIREEGANQPTFAKVILDGEKISEQRLGTIYGYRTKLGKGDDGNRQPIDDEIARSLLDLSKGAEQAAGSEDSQDSQNEKQGERLGSLIGALIDRTAMAKGDSPVKVIIQQEGLDEQVIIEGTASPVAGEGKEKKEMVAKVPTSTSGLQFIFTPDASSKSGAGTIRITHSGFVPPIFFSKESKEKEKEKEMRPSTSVDRTLPSGEQILRNTGEGAMKLPTVVQSVPKAATNVTTVGSGPLSSVQAVPTAQGPIVGQMIRPVLLVPNMAGVTPAVPANVPAASAPRLSPQSQGSNPFRDKRKSESFEQVTPPKRPRTLSPFSRFTDRPMLGGKRPGLVRQVSVDIADEWMPVASSGADSSQTQVKDVAPSGSVLTAASPTVPIQTVLSHTGLSAPSSSVLVRQLSAPLPQVIQSPISQVPEQYMTVMRSPSPLTVSTPAIQLMSPQSQIVQVLPPGGIIQQTVGSPGTASQSPQIVLPAGLQTLPISDFTGKSGYVQVLSNSSGQLTLVPAQGYFEDLSPASQVIVKSMPVPSGGQVEQAKDNIPQSPGREGETRSEQAWLRRSHSMEDTEEVVERQRSRSPSGSRSPTGQRSSSGSRSPALEEEPTGQQKVSKLASSQSIHQHDVTYVTGENSAPFEIKPIPCHMKDEKEALVDGKYVCTTCGKLFTEQHQLTLHKNIHYMERQYRCEDCNISFRTAILLQKHRRSESHHAKLSVNQQFGIPTSENPRPYRCDDCDVAFRIHGHLAKHLRSKAHIAMLERLGKVPRGTSSQIERGEAEGSLESDPSLDNLRQIIDKANSATLFRNMEGRSSSGAGDSSFVARQSYSSDSESCEPVFTRSVSQPPVPLIIIDHVDDDDEPVNPPCSIPEIMITPATPLASVGGTIPTSSPTPESSENDPSSVRSSEYETDVQASNDRVTVEIKQELIDISEVGGRQGEPKASKPAPLIITFQCSICGAKISDKALFESHMIGHQTQSQQTTSPAKDGKQSPVPTTMGSDSASRDSGGQKCGICAKRFTSIGMLKQHLASHAELRPYVCEYCDAGFTTGQSLRIHLGTHKQESPYVCGQCGLTFAQSDDLNSHMTKEHGCEDEVSEQPKDGSS